VRFSTTMITAVVTHVGEVVMRDERQYGERHQQNQHQSQR
jgi:hypothetical protein